MSRGFDCCMSCKWRNDNPYESCIDCFHGDEYEEDENDEYYSYKDYA